MMKTKKSGKVQQEKKKNETKRKRKINNKGNGTMKQRNGNSGSSDVITLRRGKMEVVAGKGMGMMRRNWIKK